MVQPKAVSRLQFLVTIAGLVLLLPVMAAAQGGADCCIGRVGDANGLGGDEPTIGDISTIIDVKFLLVTPPFDLCIAEADVNQSGGANPTWNDVTIGDISILIDYLFITGPSLGLADCLSQTTDPYGYVVDRTDCKSEAMSDKNLAAGYTCILYEYDGVGSLSLTHENAGLNCCPIPSFEIDIEDFTITITESDSGLCDCYCLYDIDYRIENLPPGEYQIVVNEAFNVIGDPLSFTADLTHSTWNLYCVPRGGYPWSGELSGLVVDHSGCLSDMKTVASAAAPANQSCIRYEYDGSGVLTMFHANAGFNCCPDDLLVDVSLDGGTVTITESETLDQGGCACLCLFDLEFWVVNLPPGIYNFVFVEPYVDGEMEPLEFTLDLFDPTSGEYCVERAEYPWDQLGSAVGTLVSHTSCKEVGAALSAEAAQSCIEYDYDGQGTLSLTHVNAGFNCCPTELLVEFSFMGNEIYLQEMEDLSDGGCHCLCLYDLEIEITGVSPGSYWLSVNELYDVWPDPMLRFELDLSEATSGSFCVERNTDPWGP